jgi:hypothetical protein
MMTILWSLVVVGTGTNHLNDVVDPLQSRLVTQTGLTCLLELLLNNSCLVASDVLSTSDVIICWYGMVPHGLPRRAENPCILYDLKFKIHLLITYSYPSTIASIPVQI